MIQTSKTDYGNNAWNCESVDGVTNANIISYSTANTELWAWLQQNGVSLNVWAYVEA